MNAVQVVTTLSGSVYDVDGGAGENAPEHYGAEAPSVANTKNSPRRQKTTDAKKEFSVCRFHGAPSQQAPQVEAVCGSPTISILMVSNQTSCVMKVKTTDALVSP
eukprot:TRINITY_DN19219_c0_g1_i1.p2 TRINITY_DN19219_c0_g1~~TRINITY_DN19219_c0_g1_i1.p2  ORF type:complete len:105 (+),score=8.59 TRINITY_DN19219_c0_g1_i1:433-747(+)